MNFIFNMHPRWLDSRLWLDVSPPEVNLSFEQQSNPLRWKHINDRRAKSYSGSPSFPCLCVWERDRWISSSLRVFPEIAPKPAICDGTLWFLEEKQKKTTPIPERSSLSPKPSGNRAQAFSRHVSDSVWRPVDRNLVTLLCTGVNLI